ncbi:MAG TPA: DUF3467 domain-containing protein [Thermoanaerobaculia bacterium]|nr:DUF3467 domain-containing protein [Thermoanaerobaculia bacterium]
MEQQNQSFRIVLDERIAQGEYVNFANIIHSPAEFVVDLGRIMPGRPEARVCSRVVMTPQHAKQLLQALAQNVNLYEQKYGTIEVHVQQPAFQNVDSEPSN